jgi:hypothetical protein
MLIHGFVNDKGEVLLLYLTKIMSRVGYEAGLAAVDWGFEKRLDSGKRG